MMKIDEALQQGIEMLKDSKSDIALPSLEAQLILGHILNKSRETLIAYGNDALGDEQKEAFFKAVEKRAAGCPLAYITGKKEFMNITFFVDENVLIPRDDTQKLVDCVLSLAAEKKDKTEILNIGTGSGCIEVALALNNKNIFITGVDKYKNALQVARRNIDYHNLQDRIALLESDLFSSLDENCRFDIICSNPPYISEDEIKGLSIDITHFEPHSALYGGKDGLHFYRRIIKESANHLHQGGKLIVEIGCTQAESVKQIFHESGFINVSCMQDLSGQNRVVYGEKNKNGL